MEGAWSLESDANVPARTEPSFGARLEAELPPLARHAAALVGRAGPDADDVVQEVLARAWRSRESFDARRALRPWLRATALRAWIDLCRARALRADVEARRGADPQSDAGPARDVEAREELEHALSPLDAVEREVLVRFHHRGESVRDIATALALAEGTVKSHLHRARKKLTEREERP
ncbi:MAG: RNA polymerase sigma factor [Planctomycetes bacterium]|nr:RNA polymerase sigma factor [Planctomycetota bacterium]